VPTIDPGQIEAEWAAREKRIHGELVKEGMRRHPDNLERAYQWAYDQIHQIKNPPVIDNFAPVKYEGTI